MTEKTKQTITLDDEQWNDLMERTDGEIARCYQCGTCTATCPWGSNGGEPMPVRDIMRRSQLGVNGAEQELYQCLTCKACETGCPRGVDITEVILGLREKVFEEKEAPGDLENALWSVYEQDNPWERPASDRGAWMNELPEETDVPVGAEAQVLYYVGCAPSYDPALQDIPVAIVQLLQAADVDVTVLGDEEVCCGDVVRQTGEPDFFEELSELNAESFSETDAELIVTSSPHCAETFRKDYDLDADVVHYSEYLLALYENDRLVFEDRDQTVTYHDPCYLSRGMKITEAPRKLLDAAGVEVDEMKQSGRDTLCCGGGGGQMWNENEMEMEDERFSERRVKQAAETDAEELLTACPYCIQMLKDGVKTTDVDLPVRDLAVFLLESIDPDAEITEDTSDDILIEVRSNGAPSPAEQRAEASPTSDDIETPTPTMEYVQAMEDEVEDEVFTPEAIIRREQEVVHEETKSLGQELDEEIDSSREREPPSSPLPDGVTEMDLLEAWHDNLRRNVLVSEYALRIIFNDG